MHDHIGAHKQEETVAVAPESDVPPPPELEEAGRPSVEPKNLQEYWRWVQLQLLRERVGRTIPRE